MLSALWGAVGVQSLIPGRYAGSVRPCWCASGPYILALIWFSGQIQSFIYIKPHTVVVCNRCGMCAMQNEDAASVELQRMSVAAESRGKGAGGQLVKAVVRT